MIYIINRKGCIKTRSNSASFSAVTVKWSILTIFPAKELHLSVITDIYFSIFLFFCKRVRESENWILTQFNVLQQRRYLLMKMWLSGIEQKDQFFNKPYIISFLPRVETFFVY